MHVCVQQSISINLIIKYLRHDVDTCSKVTDVAEPPELYGPHVPTIVLQTPDTAHASQTTLVVCRMSSGKLESSMFYNSYRINKGVVTTLQHLI
jgi:hypothetical protein